MKRILRIAAALVLALLTALPLAACGANKKPEATIVLEMGGETREIRLVLYRKYAPETVENFIRLAREGYYDGLCISDITASTVRAGDYAVDEEQGDGSYTVRPSESRDTIKGEFYNNGFVVENQPLKHVRGSISMYRPDPDDYDGASTAFFFSATAISTYDRNYCVFGECKDEESRKVIDDLVGRATVSWTDPNDEDVTLNLPEEVIRIRTIRISD